MKRKRHGRATTPEYRSWHAALSRCTKSSNGAYPRYGGRGITICEEWRNEEGFINFLKDMGEKPIPKDQYSLDRIKNNGNYEPSNCRWATRSEQAFNRPTTIKKHRNPVANTANTRVCRSIWIEPAQLHLLQNNANELFEGNVSMLLREIIRKYLAK